MSVSRDSSNRHVICLQVALKFVDQRKIKMWAKMSESKDVLPLEIALLQQVCRLPRSRGVAQLLDYYWMPGPEGAGIYLLVLERPIPCLDLFNYMQEGSGYLEEGMARHVMQQVVSALLHCHSRGVVHRDLKPENILVELTNHNVLLLDFGSASVLKEGEYTDVAGETNLHAPKTHARKHTRTPEYLPPETVLRGEYFAVPATVWSLGILLFQVHYYKLRYLLRVYGISYVSTVPPTCVYGTSYVCLRYLLRVYGTSYVCLRYLLRVSTVPPTCVRYLLRVYGTSYVSTVPPTCLRYLYVSTVPPMCV
ncbi:serine/threonine-protein kinase pim-2-like [Oncorhynchus mykiss]|uniref:serine/threonine-protein kinase pim-2-like n=1 Tax=Oncorhynchus mykiss TaxID=8022 RepID=UPI00187895A0|nr:serine/threonine-protein kinase pim-2-like [Oncorhynchus mykiss]